MPKFLSQAEVADRTKAGRATYADGGNVTSLPVKAAPAAPAPPAPAPAPRPAADEQGVLQQLAQTLLTAQRASNLQNMGQLMAAMKDNTAAMAMIRKAIDEHRIRPPEKWSLAVQRDKQGRITNVIATEIRE